MCEILLIDDDPTQLRLREAVLREAGFTVGTAETASQALKALGHPELRKALVLIITDQAPTFQRCPSYCHQRYARGGRGVRRVGCGFHRETLPP